ncbi:MAG: hypothetical protein WHS88_08335 [Anaerohalosphaeraceae bacterium]
MITFNYDRSFEYYFLCALAAKYKVPAQEAARIFSNLRIVHVYGQLGELPELVSTDDEAGKEKAVPYDSFREEKNRWGINLRNAADGIQLLWDTPNDKISENIKKAQEIIYQQNNTLLFLGFGFDPTNIERIMPIKEIDIEISAYGTFFGLPKQRIADLRSKYTYKYRGAVFSLFGGDFFPKNDFVDCKIYDFLYNSHNLMK